MLHCLSPVLLHRAQQQLGERHVAGAHHAAEVAGGAADETAFALQVAAEERLLAALLGLMIKTTIRTEQGLFGARSGVPPPFIDYSS